MKRRLMAPKALVLTLVAGFSGSAGTVLLAAGAALAPAPATPHPDVIATPAAPSPAILAALADPARPKTDTDRDALRKPAALLVFAGIKPGDQVADIIPGQGYFTRPFATIVGPKGHVFAIVPSSVDKLPPGFGNALKKGADAMNALASSVKNVSALIEPLEKGAKGLTPSPLDLVWTSQNYHDVYGYFGEAAAGHMNEAVFAALKPGGVYVVVDHAATAGSGARDATTLHRIDPATVKAQVLAAGFLFDGESDVLHNAADPHTVVVFAPEIRGRTDQFVFKFHKP